MSHPIVSTTEPGMQSAANLFADNVSTFNGYLQTVNGDMAALQASWQGTASAQFNAAMDNWEAAFRRVINELVGMMDTMGVNTSWYREQEDAAATLAQDFGKALPGV